MPANPAFPNLNTDTQPESDLEIPEAVINSVLGQWGYGERTSDEPADPPAPVEDAETPAAEVPDAEIPDLNLETEAPSASDAEVPESPAEPEDDVPVPPGGPVFGAEGTPETAPGPVPSAPTFSPAQLQAWAELDARIQSDPQFRQGLSALLSPQATPAPTARPLPPLPQLSADDLQEPAVQALLILAEHQRQELAEIKQQVTETQRQTQVRQYHDSTEVVNGATSQFQTTYNLPDEIMAEVRDIAGRNNAMNLYMAGIHPQTGAKVEPNPYKAVEAALEMAYWNSPLARVFEIERQSAHREKTAARKQKLAGVGGSSGSASRAPVPFDLTSEQGRRDAMVAEVRAAMNADEV